MSVALKEFAPVIIPTLNRFNHFMRCVESLSMNPYAVETELIIGLDYPPSDKYKEGYQKIKEYIPSIKGFKKVTVLERTQNYGALKNADDLFDYAFQKNNIVIFTEDDNVFSPCFLEYMNKGLEKYKEDDRVTYICGYTPPTYYRYDNANVQCCVDTPAYGIGCWKDYEKYLEERNLDWFYEELKKDHKRTWRLFKRYPAVIYMMVALIWDDFNPGDLRRSILNMLNNTYTICPTVSMVRNIGADGSGLHSGFVKGRDQQEILAQDTFDLDDINLGVDAFHEEKLRTLNMPKGFVMRSITMIQYYLVVILFLFVDNRKSNSEPLSLPIRLINNLWHKMRFYKNRILSYRN